jgi:tubulin-specific chaperone D
VGKVGEDAAADGGEWIEPAEEDIVEQVVESLLRALRHRDTVVRWSAAKGVGRITGRLPREHAEDVVQAVVDLFTSPSMARADSAWHGGCLALAELARRGLILPATPHFDALFGVVRSAAAFDVRRGAHSVGAHVRDAACYAVWALSRAYTTADVAPHALDIAETMIPVALLDREVNCRRAAAAAVQECVGRLSRGVIVEGVELVTLVDYFSLGDRVAAYTRIAPAVASLAGGLYFACILDELWAGKLVHWDVAIRRLAARALAALAPLDARRVLVTAVFPRLLQVAVQRGDAMHRHGAVLGLAELTLALGQSIPEQLRGSLRAVPGRMGARGYYKGRVGDLMQAAACRLIEACARADIGVDSTDAALSILEHALAAGNGELDAVAVSAYKQLCLGAAPGDAVCDRIVRGLTASSSPVELRRGFALAAGALGDRLATPAVYSHLVDALVCHGDVGVRRNAAISLGRLTPVREARLARDIALACVAGMGDYAVDERGDVGSWVREVSMEAFASLVESSVGVLDDAPCLAAVKAVVCQSCERIGRTRDVAGATLARLIAASPAGLRRTDAALRRIGAAATDARTLLTLDDVWRAALTGVVTSCAGGTAARRWAMDCIRAHAAALGAQDLVSFGDALVSMVAGDVERLVVPAMAALEFLVRDGVFNGCGAFLLRAAAAARATWKGRLRDMPRVAAAVNLLCELAVVGAGTRRPSLEALVVVLAGPVPRLRRLSAEGLYVALVADAGRAVLDMIADTPWEHLPVGDVRAARGRLCDLLDIAPPGSPAP